MTRGTRQPRAPHLPGGKQLTLPRARGRRRGRIVVVLTCSPLPSGHLITCLPGFGSQRGVVSGLLGPQVHRTLRLSLPVRYRLWEAGNVCETGQAGGGKRLGLVSGRQAGGLGGGLGSPPSTLQGGAHTGPGSQAAPVAGVSVGLGPGGGHKDRVARGLLADSVQIPTLPFPSSVALGTLRDVPVPQFLPLSVEMGTALPHGACGLNGL